MPYKSSIVWTHMCARCEMLLARGHEGAYFNVCAACVGWHYACLSTDQKGTRHVPVPLDSQAVEDIRLLNFLGAE